MQNGITLSASSALELCSLATIGTQEVAALFAVVGILSQLAVIIVAIYTCCCIVMSIASIGHSPS